MKITKLIIEDFQQFQNFELDLTYPADHPTKAGMPLDKVCLVGKNGTGKTTILEMINKGIGSVNSPKVIPQIKLVFLEIELNKYQYGVFISHGSHVCMKIEQARKYFNQVKNGLSQNSLSQKIIDFHLPNVIGTEMSNEIKIYIPSESAQNNLLNTNSVPQTNLNNALNYSKYFPKGHIISYENVANFWNLVIYQVKRREEIRMELLSKAENQTKTIQEFQQEFEANYPDFLYVLSEEWKRILDRAGLYFDYAKAKNPVQLTDNLEAYIKDKHKHETINYYQLSSGIRHFIFKIGYLKALFFGRQVDSAIAMIDEPENSLFPNLLYDMVDIYQNIAPNTQFFFATHSPIIAGQFEPCERIILDFDEAGKVLARKGTAPEGDDPNDLLLQDFGLESILGKKGKEKLERYIELKALIKFEEDENQKTALIKEFMQIGNQYHF